MPMNQISSSIDIIFWWTKLDKNDHCASEKEIFCTSSSFSPPSSCETLSLQKVFPMVLLLAPSPLLTKVSSDKDERFSLHHEL